MTKRRKKVTTKAKQRTWPVVVVGALGLAALLQAPLPNDPNGGYAYSGSTTTTTTTQPLKLAASTKNTPCHVMARAVYDTGLRGRPLVRLVATGLAENPKCDRAAKLRNGPTPGCPNGSTDRWLFQFNNCYHKEVRCSSAACDAKAAKKISKNGTDFHEWATTRNGRQAAAMKQATKLVAEVSK